MPQRSERQVTHPWLMARQNAREIELPPGAKPPPSAAREALEAAFSAVSSPLQDAQTDGAVSTPAGRPEIIVKRKRLLVAPTVGSAPQPRDDEPHSQVDQDRGPRVFRVDTPPAPTPEPISPAPAAAARAPESAEVPERPAAGIKPLPVIPARRPRRRAMPAVVLKFDAPAPDAADSLDQDAAERAMSADTEDPYVEEVRRNTEADELRARLARLQVTLDAIRDARDFRLMRNQHGDYASGSRTSYVALLSRLKQLREQAELLRRQDLAQELPWMREAIHIYGISARDLGL